MKTAILLLLLPVALWAQEFEFRQEFDTIPVEIDGWELHEPWAGGLYQSSPALTDIDADGDFDIFVGVFSGIIYSFQNNGNSSLAAYDLTSYQFDSITVDDQSDPGFGDLDADGDPDLLVSNLGDGWLFFYRNVGTSQQPDFVREDTLNGLGIGPPWCTSPELVDIDADGDYDLFGGNLSAVSFYGNFGTPQNYDFQLVTGGFAGIGVGSYAQPDFVDIDADGDYDLFVGNGMGKIYFYRNDGDSANYNFTFVTDHYNGIDVGDYASPEFADIDGDGDYDLFVGRDQLYDLSISPGDIFFYQNVGTPQAAQWQYMTHNYLSIDVGYIGAMAATDIDADGDRDLFIQNTGDHVSFYENIGIPAAASYHWVTDSYPNIVVNDAYPCFADIDNDQDPDLFMGQGAIPGPPGLHLFVNQGTPQSPNLTLYSNNLIPGVFTQNSVILAPAVADIDADGDLDLFISDMDEHFYFFRNTGSPTLFNFDLQSSNWQGIGPILASPSFFYDIDEDGDLDLFLSPANDWNLMLFYCNVGSPQIPQMVLETSNFLPLTGMQLCYGIDVSDLDQDGDGDFLLSTGSGGMLFFRNIAGEVVLPPMQRQPLAGLQISLGQNPANPNTVISFSLPSAQQIDLGVYNLLGARVATLASGFHLPGEYRYVWDASRNASGVYIVRLDIPGTSLVGKLTVLK